MVFLFLALHFATTSCSNETEKVTERPDSEQPILTPESNEPAAQLPVAIAPPPLFGWEKENRRNSRETIPAHSLTKLWKWIEKSTQLVELIESFENSAASLNSQFGYGTALQELSVFKLLCSEFLILAKGETSNRRIRFIAQEFQWLKGLDNPRFKEHYGKYQQYYRQKSRWLPFFIGAKRTALEKRLIAEKPSIVLKHYPSNTDAGKILSATLEQFLKRPTEPPVSALDVFDWAWSKEALQYYVAIYETDANVRKGLNPSMTGLKAKFREGRLRHSLGQPSYLEVIEEAARGGLPQAMLFAARSHAKLSEKNPRNCSSALFWYWRIKRHRTLDFLAKIYPSQNHDLQTGLFCENGFEPNDYIDEAQKYEDTVKDNRPRLLFDWYLSMEERDPLFKTKLGKAYFTGYKAGQVKSNKTKGIEYLSASAIKREPNAVLLLARHYYEKCQFLLKSKTSKDEFFRWANVASKIQIPVAKNGLKANVANAYGHYYLSFAYLKGIGCSKDKTKRWQHLENAARLGYAKAGEELAKGYENGTWGNRSPWRALAWYQWSDPKNARIKKILNDLRKDTEALGKANALLSQLTNGINYRKFND